MKITDIPTLLPHPAKPPAPETAAQAHPDAHKSGHGKADKSVGNKLVVVKDPMPPEAVEGSGRTHTEHPLAKMLVNTDARSMSPREVTNLGFELYAAGVLQYDEYADLAYQPELDPDFNETIGALTGEVARPDTKRDFIKDWEMRYDFLSRHRPKDSHAAERALHILGVLRRIESPTDVSA